MSEQEQDSKTKQPDEPKKEKKDIFVLMLLPGETATFERAPKKNLNDPPQWNVRVDTPGRKNDQVRVTYPMDKELEVTGMGTDATIVIPETVGKNAGDMIPKIKVRSDDPPMIIGGDVIITGGTALIPVSPKGFIAENKPIVNDGEKDPRLEKDSMSIRFDADKDASRGVRGDKRTVTVEREPETKIIFIDPSTRDPKDPKSKPKEFYTLSALDPKKSVEDYEAVIANRDREAEKGKGGGKKKEPPKETRKLTPISEQEQQAVRQTLGEIKTSLEQLKGGMFAKDADIDGLIKAADENSIMVGNTIERDKLKELRTKLQGAIDATTTSPINNKLLEIKSKLETNEALQKITMAPQDLSRDALAAAIDAARPTARVAGDTAQDYGTGRVGPDKVAIDTGSNKTSNLAGMKQA